MLLQKAHELIKNYSLCSNCLGRQFAVLGSGTTNRDRGASLKETLMMEADKEIREKSNPQKMKDLAKTYDKANEALVRRGYEEQQEKQECFLCENLFQKLDELTKKALEEIKELEFDSFLFGTKLHKALADKEEKLWMEHGADYSESIKSELNREIGKRIEKKTDKEVDFKKPDVVIHLHTQENKIETNINPLYIYGRYRKLNRKIPQCEWNCPICRGEGCMRCDETGYLYEDSVEQIISRSLLKKTKGIETKFHGCGREDVDVRMLGEGRPFVIEVKEPKKRKIDLKDLEKEINTKNDEIEVKNLEYSDKDKVVEIKQAKAPKVYRAKITINGASKKKIKQALTELEDSVIQQKTPKRINRRPEKTRQRKIYKTNLIDVDKEKAIIKIEAESGLYIKELISGDEGRTRPSLSSLVEKELECKELDVIEVKY